MGQAARISRKARTADERSAGPAAATALIDSSPRGERLSALAQLARHGPAITAQRRRLNGMFGTEPHGVVQGVFAKIDSIQDDLWHPQWQSLFDGPTTAAMNRVVNGPPNTWRGKTLAYLQSRAEGARVGYQVTDSEELTNRQQLEALEGRTEIMYVGHGGKVYVTGRDGEKKPHPMLVGGDPDVTDAGTIAKKKAGAWSNSNFVATNSSGHFKPGDVSKETLNAIGVAANTHEDDPTAGEEGWETKTTSKSKKLFGKR
ncbi:MAG TPA: hypothetical protein VF495_01980 [Phenylobacterium sp.]|jgi:hypothetical protein